MIPSIGRIVHFVLPNGEHRPAIIVRVSEEKPTENSVVQLQVFTDGSNDASQHQRENSLGLLWRTSVRQDNEAKLPGTWHEAERV